MCPGTERPRPWRTPISSSTSSLATQVRAPGAARRVSAACGPGLRGKRCRAAARAPTPPGASLPAAPLHFRSAGAGDVGTASGRGLAGPARSPCPEQPAAGGRGGSLRRLVWEVYDRRGLPAQGRQGQAQTIAILRQGSITLGLFAAPVDEKGRQRRAEGDGRRIGGFLNSPTFSDLHPSTRACAKRSLVWDSRLRRE